MNEQRLQPSEILKILNSCVNLAYLAVPQQEQQTSKIFQAFIHLNYYLLMQPESLTQNFREPLMLIFQNPPDIKIMEICTNCIINALKSGNTRIVQPSDFPYQYIMTKIRSQQLSDDTVLNLLDIIYIIMNQQGNYIKNVNPSDIDYFFKYFNILNLPSQINCIRCINTIISLEIFDHYCTFLPNLLDILNNNSTDERIYQPALNSTMLIINDFLRIRHIKPDLFDPVKYCEKLCIFTSNFKDKRNLSIFIHSIILCSHFFIYTRDIVIGRLDISSFIDNTPNNPVFESILNLIYFLVPLQNNDLIEMINLEKFKSNNKKITPELIVQIQNVFNSLCNVYCSNLNLSKKCLQMISILVNSTEFNLVFSNKFIFMLYFQIQSQNREYFPYILSILRDGIRIKQNIELLLQSGIFELIGKTICKLEFSLNYFCEKNISELMEFNQSNRIQIINDNGIKNISQLVNLIDSNPFYSNNIFAIYNQKLVKKLNHLYFNQFSQLFEDLDDLNSIEDDVQKVVYFFLKLLADIPNPIIVEDSYFPNYDLLFQRCLRIGYSNYPLNSILAENDGTIYSILEMRKLFYEYQGVLKPILDETMLNESTHYVLNILNNELKELMRSGVKINDKPLNDMDQFVLKILPQILDPSFKDLNIQLPIDLHSFEYFRKNDLEKPSKMGTLIARQDFSFGNQIIENIVNLLCLINKKDKNHSINFVYEPLQTSYIDQLKYFYLSICLFSPCSKMMVNYPFLFDMNDRLFLFKLLIKEPIMAKDHYDKKYNPRFAPVQRQNHSILKFIVNRKNIFKEGLLILERFAKYGAVFEIKFRGEMGQGRGLTKEFFHIMSKEFCKKRHRLWRRDNFESDDSDKESMKLYAHNKKGLFPYATANSRYMYDLGLFVAKAIQMEEVIDIPFNPCFFDLANGKDVDLKDVDEVLYNSLNDPYTAEALLGFPFKADVEGKSFNLVKNGDNIFVTKENFHIYKDELTKFVCGKYVRRVVNYFVNGFSEVLDPSLLKMFSGSEMVDVINGQRELFSYQDLQKFIMCGNGYDMGSLPVQLLFQVVSEFDKTYQKLFLQFVTGSPFLPIGGMEALDPPITIIRKYATNENLRDEDYLPSSQTCINTFYLPPYSTKEMMKEKIIKVITECRESFDLI